MIFRKGDKLTTTVIESELSEFLSSDLIKQTSSGSAALITALQLLPWKNNAEILIPSICCPSVLSAVQITNFTPVFVDMETSAFNMSFQSIRDLANENTAAIIFVHSFGIAGYIVETKEFCEKEGIFLIEDTCMALGGVVDDHYLGTYGDAAVFSFGYDKIISGNMGGAIVLKKECLYEGALGFLKKNEFFTECSYNNDSIKYQFANLNSTVSKRNSNARIFFNELDSKIVDKPEFKQSDVYWRYPVLYKRNRDELLRKARELSIIITTHYPSLHRFQYGSELKVADNFNESVLNFFIRPEVDESYIKDVCDLVNSL